MVKYLGKIFRKNIKEKPARKIFRKDLQEKSSGKIFKKNLQEKSSRKIFRVKRNKIARRCMGKGRTLIVVAEGNGRVSFTFPAVLRTV